MKNIFRIYKRDIKNIVTNYVALIVILALIILPALYAWFNIAAGWDPYSNTKNLSVAIVNLDEGSEFRNVKINAGKDIVSKLKSDQNIGWKFVNKDQAGNGVKTGKYYASITITKDFSKNLLSIIRDNVPKKSQLIYSVNEKVNAIAPKITKSGATALEEEIAKNFIKTCSDTVLSYLNQFGIELEHIKPQLQNIADVIMDMDKNMPQISNYIDTAYTSSLIFKQYLNNIQENIPVISDSLNKTIVIAKSGNEFMEKSKSSIQMIPSGIKSDLNDMKNSIDSAAAILNGIKTSINQDQNKIKESLVSISNIYNSLIKKADDNIQFLNSLNQYADSNIIANFIDDFSKLKDKLISQENFISSIIDYIDAGKQVPIEDINSAINGVNEILNLISSIDDNFNRNIFPQLQNIMENIPGISSNAVEMLQDAQKNIPLMNSLIGNVSNGVNIGSNMLKGIKDRFPEAENNIHSDAEKIQRLSGDKKLNEVINILERNAKEESDFLANPVEMNQERVYPIPNYGSAMAPFYTTLALWVGAFILLSILSVEVKKFDDNSRFSSKDQFFGRYLTFTTITIMQAIVVAVGNLFILKTYVSAPFMYIIYGIYISIVFTMIVYTLVSVFGNVGKALTMIALVLQVSASGGTFPVELMSSFFRWINPLLPFTYAIGGMRETVGGILKSSLVYNTSILSIYFILFMLIGIFLKEKVNELSKKFVNMFKRSGLVE